MIVEPASIHSRSPWRRLRRTVGFITPLALLAALLAGGLLGPKPSRDAGVAASASAVTAETASAVPTAPVPSRPAAPPPEAAAAFPASVSSLAATRPSALLSARASRMGAPGVYAVAGFLALAGQASACAAPMITFGAWCVRAGTLFESPTTNGLDPAGMRPPHLHVTIPPGVVLPSVVTSGAQGPAGTIAVIAIGRFEAPGSCGGDPTSCDQGFVVERVLWADGHETGLQPLREPGQSVRAVDPTRPPFDQSSLTLVAVLARPATIARLDPAAGRAAAALKPEPKVVWYVRQVTGLGAAPQVAWALVDPATGRRLAGGPSTMPTTAGMVPVRSPLPSGTGG